MEDKPYITISHDVEQDADYGKWLNELESRYLNARTRAAVKVNGEKLLWNWQTGRDLVVRKAEERWGSGIVEQLSLDLQARFPGEKGFSSRNISYMKQWYLFYFDKLHQVEVSLQIDDNQKDEFLHQSGAELEERLKRPIREWLYLDNRDISKTSEIDELSFPKLFALVPWRHHIEIIAICKTIEEALFYLRKTIDEGWSRNVLQRSLKSDLYHKQGGAITNFSSILPIPHADLVQEITKENYDFGFLTLPNKYSEEQLEEALCEQMTRFLLELGNGFAFVGRQKELVVDGTSRRIDLLFYHIHLRCYVVVELKAAAFQPEFAGKLNFYVTAVNHLLKSPNDNPTIGLLICSNMKKTEVKWSFDTINAPIGVATYSNIEELKKQLPTIEQLQTRIKLLEAEIKENMKKEK